MNEVLSLRGQITELLFFGLFTIIINLIAWNKGFFNLPAVTRKQGPSFGTVTLVFIIFTIVQFISPICTIPFLKNIFQQQYKCISLSIFFTNVVIFTAFFLISRATEKKFFQSLWQPPEGRKSVLFSILTGIGTWFIAFPLVSFVESSLNFIILNFFKVPHLPDQMALQLLTMTLSSPFYFIIALITIIVFAPIIEELLFRAFLQQWLKEFVSRKSAIVLTAICFALFHFTLRQEWHNLSILSAIFVFSCFLSLLYEKEQSLFAPIALHATFNAFSALNFVFFKTIANL